MNLTSLQKKQFAHDRNFHQDIVSLSTQNRAKHIVLHFVKYMGKIICGKNNIDKQLYADIIICCLSLANTLKFKLDLDANANTNTSNSLDGFLTKYTVSVSKMAKACESLDHMESFPSYDILKAELDKLTLLSINFITSKGIDISNIIKKRWKDIEKNGVID